MSLLHIVYQWKIRPHTRPAIQDGTHTTRCFWFLVNIVQSNIDIQSSIFSQVLTFDLFYMQGGI